MNIGCLDLGCMEVSDKLSGQTPLDSSETKANSASSHKSTSGPNNGRSRSPKGNGQSTLNALNKFTSQIKKPSHRKSSPINWFPRKKVDSYLKRKIKMLQEVDGMNLSLDETLGDSNPHYCRILREKIAAREAAHRAMEARKAALVEASWCRILHAARIQSKHAEAKLLKAEETAAEAFEAAISLGVIMYEMTNCPQKFRQMETSSANTGKATAHKVTASFETAFEVDKQVAAAVKTAFIKLASCPSFDKDEFRSLLHKISHNPDVVDSNQESSGCKSESGSEVETQNQNDALGFHQMNSELAVPKTRGGKCRRRQSFEKLNATCLVDMMLERLRCLKEDELSSLATIVATCGLNAALAEVENSKLNLTGSTYQTPIDQNFTESKTIKKKIESELPSLDKFLVKHMTKLEREVLEAKSRKRNEVRDGNFDDGDKADSTKTNADDSACSLETVPDLGCILVKHSSKFEREIEEAKKNSKKYAEFEYRKTVSDVSSSGPISDLGSILVKHSSKFEKEIQEQRRNLEKTIHMNVPSQKREIQEVPSLDQYLVKHVSRLEKDVQEAKSKSNTMDKENADMNKKEDEKTSDLDKKQSKTTEPLTNTEDSLDKILVKPVHRLEREKTQALPLQNQNKHREIAYLGCETLDKVLVKHVSKLEKEKIEFSRKEEEIKPKKNSRNMSLNAEGSLDEVLIKRTPRLERMKMASLEQPEEEVSRVFLSRRQARERELQEAWGGLSLGNSIKPHVSKLERDKAAWIKAEEEERRRANEG